MSRGVNKVILIGYLGDDPAIHYTQTGTPVATLSIGTTDKWKDKQTGALTERTEWHRVTLWGRLGEVAGQYLRKGSRVYVEGSLRTNKYTDKNNIERYSTNIHAIALNMLDKKREPDIAQDPRPQDGFGNPHQSQHGYNGQSHYQQNNRYPQQGGRR